MSRMKILDWAAIGLLIVGGLNWGLVGAFNFNLVTKIVPAGMVNVVYILVGLASVYSVYSLAKKR